MKTAQHGDKHAQIEPPIDGPKSLPRFIFYLICIEAEKGELGSSPAERTISVDPWNLIQLILAEGK